METKQERSFIKKVPSWLLTILLLIISVIALLITDSIMTPRTETGLLSHIINDAFIASGCYFIVSINPKSIWYVPIISNVVYLLSAFTEPNFWQSSMVIPICGGWALSLVVSFIAAWQGKRSQIIQ